MARKPPAMDKLALAFIQNVKRYLNRLALKWPEYTHVGKGVKAHGIGDKDELGIYRATACPKCGGGTWKVCTKRYRTLIVWFCGKCSHVIYPRVGEKLQPFWSKKLFAFLDVNRIGQNLKERLDGQAGQAGQVKAQRSDSLPERVSARSDETGNSEETESEEVES